MLTPNNDSAPACDRSSMLIADRKKNSTDSRSGGDERIRPSVTARMSVCVRDH